MKSITVILAVIFALGMWCGCSGAGKEGDTAGDKQGSENLCKEYTSCNECIAGLQKNRGIDHGQAQSECSMAASGCWTTWEKPVKCGE
jgi:hypothetical protein